MSFAEIIVGSLVLPILNIIFFMIIAGVIASWLVAFNVINLNNPTVRQIYYILERFNNAILDPIRRIIPSFGGLDFSPIVALLGIQLLQNMIVFKLLPALS